MSDPLSSTTALAQVLRIMNAHVEISVDDYNTMKASQAFCPRCGGSLEYTKSYTLDKNSIAQLHENYHCVSCEKDFVFHEKE